MADRRIFFIVIVPLLAALPIACASLAGLSSGGGDGGARTDAGTSADVPLIPLDALARDSGRPRDAGRAVDATKPVDAHADVTRVDAPGLADAGSGDVACVTFIPPEAGLAPACAVPDAGDSGVCYPRAITPPLVLVPGKKVLGQCTAPLLDELYTDCFSDQGSANACDTYTSGVGADCYDCMFGQTPYGPYLLIGDVGYQPNIGGCLELTEPCQTPCGEAFYAQYQCEHEACGYCPPAITDECISNQADMCACSEAVVAVEACAVQLQTDPVALACMSVDGDPGAVMKSYGLLFCGPYPDGGAPRDAGGGVEDAHAGD
jgi:hypothetical protein